MEFYRTTIFLFCLPTTYLKKKLCHSGVEKKMIEYIEENEMPIKVKELKKVKDQNLLWESIIILKELVAGWYGSRGYLISICDLR